MQRGTRNLYLNQTLHVQLAYWDKFWSCKYLGTRTSNGTGQGCQQKLYLLTYAKCSQDKNLLIFIDNMLRKSEELDHAHHFYSTALARPTSATQMIWLQLQSKWENSSSHKHKLLSFHFSKLNKLTSFKVVSNRNFWNLSHQALMHSKKTSV